MNRPAAFTIVAFALFMSSLDVTIVATALHTLQADLQTSVVWAGWTITAYSLGLIVALPLTGRLADRVGRRRVFLVSITIFAVASLLCGLATNIYLLIFFRLLQAIGGAGFTPSATGIVVEHFGSARDKAVGLFGSIFSIGSMTGPVVGGLIVSYLSWRMIFFVNVPIVAILIPLALRYIPADRPRADNADAPWDIRGIAMLATGLLAVMFGLALLDDELGAPVWAGVLVVACGLVTLALLLRHVRRVAEPIIAPRLIYGRGFGVVNLINVLYGGGVTAMLALVPLYATTRYGIDALRSGTLLAAQSIMVIVVSLTAAAALRRTGYRMPMYVGAGVMAVGVVGLALEPVGMSPYAWLAMCAAIVGAGIGWAGPATRNAGLQLSPTEAGLLAGLRTTGRQVGEITAISATTLAIAQAAQGPSAHAMAYLAFGVLLILVIPIIRRVPEHRGAW